MIDASAAMEGRGFPVVTEAAAPAERIAASAAALPCLLAWSFNTPSAIFPSFFATEATVDTAFFNIEPFFFFLGLGPPTHPRLARDFTLANRFLE